MNRFPFSFKEHNRSGFVMCSRQFCRIWTFIFKIKGKTNYVYSQLKNMQNKKLIKISKWKCYANKYSVTRLFLLFGNIQHWHCFVSHLSWVACSINHCLKCRHCLPQYLVTSPTNRFVVLFVVCPVSQIFLNELHGPLWSWFYRQPLWWKNLPYNPMFHMYKAYFHQVAYDVGGFFDHNRKDLYKK